MRCFVVGFNQLAPEPVPRALSHMPTWHFMHGQGHSDEDEPPYQPGDYDWLNDSSQVSLSPRDHEDDDRAEPPVREPSNEPNQATWRCLRCDASLFVQSMSGSWKCEKCHSVDEYYNVKEYTKKVTPTGVWMYVPQGMQSPLAGRRRRRRNRGGPGPPSGPLDEGHEQAESERLTHDPEVEPHDVHHGPSRGSQRSGLPKQRPLLSDSPHRDRVPLSQFHADASSRSEENKLLKALKELVKEPGGSEEHDWDSRKGPEKGIKWKSGAPPPCPTWKYDSSDLRAFAKFSKKVQIWQLQMRQYASKKEQALLLYNSLSGEPEQELEHLTIEEIYVEDGVEKLLKMLQKPMEQRTIYQKRKFLHEFENLKRYPNELIRAYINRFRRTQRNLKSVGIDMSGAYDSESLGARLLDRSGLTQEAQRMLLVGTQQSLEFEALAEAMVLQYPDFRGAPPIASRDGAKGQGKSSRASSSASSSSASTSASSVSTRGPPAARVNHLGEMSLSLRPRLKIPMPMVTKSSSTQSMKNRTNPEMLMQVTISQRMN